jgi:hypothetical protein
MGILTSVVGFSGTGKSRSFKTLLKDDLTLRDDAIIIRTLAKPFPFKNRMKRWDKEKGEGDYIIADDGYIIAKAIEAFDKKGKKIIIVDDSTFVMVKYFMDTANQKGFDKFTDLAKQYYEILKQAERTSEDTRVYLINHLEETNLGRLSFKTIGKLISEKVDIPAMMTVVLQSEKNDEGYWFLTNKRSDIDVAKSPEDMFDDLLIPNDLDLVDKKICEYYGIKRKG